jgi:hypothetical protein
VYKKNRRLRRRRRALCVHPPGSPACVALWRTDCLSLSLWTTGAPWCLHPSPRHTLRLGTRTRRASDMRHVRRSPASQRARDPTGSSGTKGGNRGATLFSSPPRRAHFLLIIFARLHTGTRRSRVPPSPLSQATPSTPLYPLLLSCILLRLFPRSYQSPQPHPLTGLAGASRGK